MKTNSKNGLTTLLILLSSFLALAPTKAYAATSPSLGAAGSFSILGSTSVTNTGTTTTSGDLGISPGTSITNGGVLTVGGATHNNDATAIQAHADLGTAHSDIMSQGSTSSVGPALDGLTLVPGVYDIGAGQLNGGILTLSGQGVYFFRASSSFVSSGSISLIGGARACDIYWDVDTLATINGTSFTGTIIAGTGVHFGSGVSLDGRALARGGDVTMIGDIISGPSCAAVTGPGAGTGDTTRADQASAPNSACPTITPGVTAPLVLESRRVSPTSIFLSWGPFTGTDRFNIRYGTTNGNFPFNVDVTGFSTTINDLPANTPIWVEIAARNDCQIGNYGEAKFLGGTLVGGPKLPNTGLSSHDQALPWYLPAGLFIGFSSLFILIRKKY